MVLSVDRLASDWGGAGTGQAAHVLPGRHAAGSAVFALLYGAPTWALRD